MNEAEAREFTKAVAQVAAGGYELSRQAWSLGVPQALGMTHEQWVTECLGGYVRLSIPDRRDAVKELAKEGLTQEAIADVLGVGQATVSRDMKPDYPSEYQSRGEPAEFQDIELPIYPNGTPIEEPESDEDVHTGPTRIPVEERRAQGEAVARFLGRDDEIGDMHARVRVQFASHLAHAVSLVILKPEYVADAADDAVRHDVIYHFPKLRQWMDEVERSLGRGLRVVS